MPLTFHNCINDVYFFPVDDNMQIFVRADQTHTLEVTGNETVCHVKVRQSCCTLQASW